MNNKISKLQWLNTYRTYVAFTINYGEVHKMTQKELERLQNRCDFLKKFREMAEQDLKNYMSENMGKNYLTSERYQELLANFYSLYGACEIAQDIKLELQMYGGK